MDLFDAIGRVRKPAAVLGCLFAAACLVLCWLVHRATDPPRVLEPVSETVSALVRYEEVSFPSTDGERLAGLLFPGRSGAPAVILCHDAGGGKSSLLNLAAALQQAGFQVLALDFRGHGGSAGAGTTLGISEARDILGAVKFLGSEAGEGQTPPTRFGLYGIGMGAHAGVLAAREEPAIRTLVLDGLYPDAGWRLRRELYGDRETLSRWLGGATETVFNLWRRTRIRDHRASDNLPLLTGRDILLVAPAGDHLLAEQVRELYRSIPEQRNADGNMVVLPSPGDGALFGTRMELHRNRIVSFFTNRMDMTSP